MNRVGQKAMRCDEILIFARLGRNKKVAGDDCTHIFAKVEAGTRCFWIWEKEIRYGEFYLFVLHY